MNIDDLTIGQLKEIKAISGCNDAKHPFDVGSIYLIRTVTMIDTGRLVAVYPTELVLEDAAWIADTGRFAESLIKCNFNEVEPFPDGQVIIGRGSIIEAVKIKEAPRKTK